MDDGRVNVFGSRMNAMNVSFWIEIAIVVMRLLAAGMAG